MPEFNEQFQEILDQIELGLGAFENLLGLSNGMSKVIQNFDVFEHVEDVYNQDDHKIYKDFIKVGLTFVKGHPDARPTELNVTPPTADYLEKKAAEDKNKLVADVSGDVFKDIGQLSQETITAKIEETPVHEVEERKVKRKKTQSKRNKEKRKERLLKFHLKLVNSSGLPPSRLMQETPGLSSNLGDIPRRRLLNEFDQTEKVQIVDDSLRPGQQIRTPTSSYLARVSMSGNDQLRSCGIGANSGLQNSPSLCSSPHSLNVDTNVPMQQSDARPAGGMWGGQSTQGVCSGSDSGLLNQPSLPSTTQSCVGWNMSEPVLVYHQPLQYPLQPQYPPLSIPQSPPLLPQPQPVPPGGRPAYCFHCLQYGAVYSISPVC